MDKKIIISGFGGQGVMLSGNILCYGGMKEGKFVSFFPSYGAEMRGGTANCQIIISDEPIGSPVVDGPDILMAFNKPSYLKFSSKVRPHGTTILNSDLYTNENLLDNDIEIPGNTLAAEAGSSLTLNTVMLGAMISASSAVDIKSIEKAIPEALGEKKRKFWDMNIKAMYLGFNHISN